MQKHSIEQIIPEIWDSKFKFELSVAEAEMIYSALKQNAWIVGKWRFDSNPIYSLADRLLDRTTEAVEDKCREIKKRH